MSAVSPILESSPPLAVLVSRLQSAMGSWPGSELPEIGQDAAHEAWFRAHGKLAVSVLLR
jgi:hypothetical protein